MPTHTESLSHSQIPKIALPKYKAWRYSTLVQENVPGEYPFTAGLYPFKEREKILLVCLQVREDQKEQTNVFIT
jgi:methylmalonyl-CoA mutase N-terminal domain/subunit